MDGFLGEIPLKWMMWGYPYFRKPPDGQTASNNYFFCSPLLSRGQSGAHDSCCWLRLGIQAPGAANSRQRFHFRIWGFHKWGYPKNGLSINNPIKMDDLGVTPISGNHHMDKVWVRTDPYVDLI